MINVGIVGSTGYGGCELVRFLLTHPNVNIEWVSSRTYSDQEYSDVYKSYFTLLDQKCVDEDIEKYLDNVDVVFFATPQGVCAKMVNENVLKKVKVIDLSADYRIKDVETYESWYGIKHASPEFIQEAVYGLCEINREDVKNARLIANPGCYPTCSILSIYPLAKAGLIDMDTLIIDAKSGTSGAGRGAKVQNLYCEVNESIITEVLAAKPWEVNSFENKEQVSVVNRVISGGRDFVYRAPAHSVNVLIMKKQSAYE